MDIYFINMQYIQDLEALNLILEYSIEEYKMDFVLSQGFSGESPSFTPEAKQVNEICRGFIKWDGCYNITWNHVMHGCSRLEMEELGKGLCIVYDIASKAIPAWLD